MSSRFNAPQLSSAECEMERSKSKVSATANPNFFPPEILFDILSWLPSKSLIRFSAVSKSWYSLIRSPNFITTHLNRSIISCSDANLLIFPTILKSTRVNACSVRFQETLLEHHNFEFPWTGNGFRLLRFGYVSCFSNGLLCLNSLYVYSHELYLCNPSLRKLKTLPPSCTLTDGRYFYSVFGFAFDRICSDYKVVRIFYSALEWKVAPKAEVYSLKTGSWKTVELNIAQKVAKLYFWSASCNGAIHWFAGADVDQPSVILCFDLCDEVFREMVLPDRLSVLKSGFVFLFKGSLSVFVETVNEDLNDGLHYEVWVMREYGVVESWEKLFIGVVSGVRNGEVRFTMGGKVILQKHDWMPALLDLENPQLQDLGLDDIFYRVCDYMESLILLDDGVSFGAKSESLSHRIGGGQSITSSSKEEDDDA